MSNIAAADADLNAKILSGKAMEGFEEYYADGIVMQENSDEPFVGKDFNRKREEEFMGSIAEWHGASLTASAVNGDVSFGEWFMDVTFKNGTRYTATQVSVRKWQDGKIIHERFYHK